MNSFFKRQYERLYFGYHRIRNSWPIWRYILNHRTGRQWRGADVQLDSLQKEIADALKKNGIAKTDLDLLFPGRRVLEKLRAVAEEKRQENARAEKPVMHAPPMGAKGFDKHFMEYIWGGGGTNPALELKSPFIAAALDGRVLGIVGAYMDMAPIFHGFSLQSTIVVPEGSAPHLSQRWHRDPDDKMVVKIFIYLTDVIEKGAGPFMYVKGSQYGGKWRNIFPQRPPVGSYPPDGGVEKHVSAEDIEMCIGKAGTVVFCDTSGLHKGGYSTTVPRVMFATGFVSRASLHPINYTQPEEQEAAALSSLALYALQLKK